MLIWILSMLSFILFVLFVIMLIALKSKSSNELTKDFASIKTQVDNIASAQAYLQQGLPKIEIGLKGIETKVVETSSNVRENILKDVNKTRSIFEEFRAEYEAKNSLQEQMQNTVRKIENVLIGGHSRGKSGENILHEAFKQFPPGMVDYNFKVKGKNVEYALVLINKKRLPIDSKWPGFELLDRLDKEEQAFRKKEIEQEVEKLLIKKAREVSEYIDPATTVSQAIAAIPDAVFIICRRAHIEAFRDNVLLMPYSMTIPFVLSFYNLHLQYSRPIDIENLEAYLTQIEKGLNLIDTTLENSISRGATMISNAYTECKRFVADMKGSLTYLKTLPCESKRKSISSNES